MLNQSVLAISVPPKAAFKHVLSRLPASKAVLSPFMSLPLRVSLAAAIAAVVGVGTYFISTPIQKEAIRSESTAISSADLNTGAYVSLDADILELDSALSAETEEETNSEEDMIDAQAEGLDAPVEDGIQMEQIII